MDLRTATNEMPKRYLRKWQIVATTNKGGYWELSSSEQPAALRCTFDINEYLCVACFGTVVVYNMSQDTENEIIKAATTAGTTLTISVDAGYEGNMKNIWKNRVYQVIRNRVNVVDWSLSLESVNAGLGLVGNFCHWSLADGRSTLDKIKHIASIAEEKLTVEMTQNIESSKSSAAESGIGYLADELRKILAPLGCVAYVQEEKLYIVNPNKDYAPDEPIVVSPATGLIGTPTQCGYGINARLMLDGVFKYKPQGQRVQFDNALINMTAIKPLIDAQPTADPDKEYIYKIIGAHFIGDTRGQDWYVDITTMLKDGIQPVQQAS